MSDLEYAVSVLLQENGYYLEVSPDIHKWNAIMRANGAFVYSHLDTRWTQHGAAEWIGIYDGKTGQIAACLAYRVLENANFLEMFEDGRIYADNPQQWGHTFHDTGLSGLIDTAGSKIVSRGGIHSFTRGKALSFYACTLAVAKAVEVDADISAGIILPGTPLPREWYGYWMFCDTTEHKWPNLESSMRATIGWSGKRQLREEANRRTELLQAAKYDDLKAAASAYSRQYHAGK